MPSPARGGQLEEEPVLEGAVAGLAGRLDAHHERLVAGVERDRLVEGLVHALVEKVDGIGEAVELQSQSLRIEDGRVRALRGEVGSLADGLEALDRRVDEGLDALTINSAPHQRVEDLRATVQDLVRRVIDGDLAERLAELERLSRLRAPR